MSTRYGLTSSAFIQMVYIRDNLYQQGLSKMPGWIISVYRQQNYGIEPAISGAEHGVCIAEWHTGLGGIEWLNFLVKRNNAISLGGECLMFEYTAKTKYLKRELLNGPPHINMMYGYTNNIEALEACDKNEWLLIQAWDDS